MPFLSFPPPFPLVAFGVTVLSGTLYLVSAWLGAGGLGYPLDDSWIHQTLARNALLHGELSVNPGEPVAVSTALLWTVLLLPAYLLHLPPMPWTYLLGAASLVFLAWETVRMGKALLPQASSVPYLAGLGVLLEWHLVWAAFSGMETLLFAGLALALLREGMQHGLGHPRLLGALGGLLTLTRPEGLLLGVLVGGRSLVADPRARWRPFLLFSGVLLVTLLPGALLNLALSGKPLPATFYAKNAAYGAELTLAPVLQYLLGAATIFAGGPGLLAYVGLAFGLARRFPSMAPSWPIPLVWALLLLAIYMFWLPALYHHGRYLFPLVPILLLYGLEGGRLLLAHLPFVAFPRVAVALVGLVVLLAWLRGALLYAGDVGYINGQQVRLAVWARDHTPPDTVVGSHDIGALSYFSQRRLVDIAGLASPELLVSAKDVPRILQVLREKGVSYLVVLPEWYPPLYAGLTRGSWAEVAMPAVSPETFLNLPTFKVLKATGTSVSN